MERWGPAAAAAATTVAGVLSAMLLCPPMPPASALGDDASTGVETPTTKLAAPSLRPRYEWEKLEGSGPPPAQGTPSPTEENPTPTARKGLRYWQIIASSIPADISAANEALLDYAVGTINTQYYDKTGGADFAPSDMYGRWKALRVYAKEGRDGLDRLKERERAEGSGKTTVATDVGMPADAFGSREGVVRGLKWLVSTLNDPYSSYLTREELRQELERRDDGFLGLGTIVEPPQRATAGIEGRRYDEKGTAAPSRVGTTEGRRSLLADMRWPSSKMGGGIGKKESQSNVLGTELAVNLPVVTAVSPDSPAERGGIVVGDRIVSIGVDTFVGLDRDSVKRKLDGMYSAENYFGHPALTVAKPLATKVVDSDQVGTIPRERVEGYRLSRVRLPTASVEPFRPYSPPLAQTDIVSVNNGGGADPSAPTAIAGGDAIVHYELLTPSDTIFGTQLDEKVGYIRLTRFSRSATAGYVNAITELEDAGAQSYILDLRNNYGGVFQEAMLTASTLLWDPHALLCFTLNSRWGFTPHDAEEYVVDKRYPGYLLSNEPTSTSMDIAKRDNPDYFQDDGAGWVPPSSYASLHELKLNRGIRRLRIPTPPTASAFESGPLTDAGGGRVAKKSPLTAKERDAAKRATADLLHGQLQKKLVLLVNEGTASSAEVFAAALRDNGRTVSLVGARTYGKGLIQHTFPMPDGGGLRLTVAEYLTPGLQHVTKVGNARYDRATGDLVGSGLVPDLYCDGTIPTDVGADLCVGVALDVLQEANMQDDAAVSAAKVTVFPGQGPL